MKWNADLAYAVGLIASDGCLSNDRRHIDLTSKDKDQLETFARILKLTNKIGLKSNSLYKNNKCYRIEFGNVKFYKFLLEIGLTPHKSKTIASLKIPEIYFADFLRGHFDGDGCTYSYYDKRWKNSFMLYTSFCSGSKLHLEWLQSMIQNLYHLDGKIGKNTRCYQLRFAKQGSIQLLTKMYYKEDIPYLARKRSKILNSLGIIQRK